MTPFAAFIASTLLSTTGPTLAPLGAPAARHDRPGADPPMTAPALCNMTVEIWPEYDDPRVLVIYRGDLAPSTTVPADVSLRIPSDAQIHMAGSVDAKGGHIHALYRATPAAGGLEDVSFTVDVPNFYMEFYYDPLTGDDARDFTYAVVAPGDVDKLVVTVQHPRRAEGFAVSPAAQQTIQDDKGFQYDVIQVATVAAGSSTPVEVSYRKADREPSVTAQEAGTGATSSDRRTMKNILAFAAVLLVGVAAYAFFLTSRNRDDHDLVEERRPEARSGSARRASRFCTRCGQPLAMEDRYCGTCGHPARTPDTGAGATHVGGASL